MYQPLAYTKAAMLSLGGFAAMTPGDSTAALDPVPATAIETSREQRPIARLTNGLKDAESRAVIPKIRLRLLVFAFLTMFSLGGVVAIAAGDKLNIDQVPTTAKTSLKEKFPAAEPTKISRKTENDLTFYKVKLRQDGKKVEVKLKEDGTFLKIEREIDTADLPQAIRDAVQAAHKGSSITKTEQTIENDSETYEVEIQTDQGPRELELSRSGAILDDEADD